MNTSSFGLVILPRSNHVSSTGYGGVRSNIPCNNTSSSIKETSLPVIALQRMPQQAGIRTQADDWTGINSSIKRRKVQNRLNQRLYRKRRRTKPVPGKSLSTCEAAHASSNDPVLQSRTNNAQHERDNAYETELFRFISKKKLNMHGLAPAQVLDAMARFEAFFYREYLLGTPNVDQLLTLVHFNVLRALFDNASIINCKTEWLNETATSPWYSPGDLVSNSPALLWMAQVGTTNGACDSTPPVACPVNLLPTHLQQTIEHHPWIDLFPFPRMRDNLLLAADQYDEWDLCNDLVDFHGLSHEKTGLIVWSDPWDSLGWEVSESFVHKWPWVVQGCDDLLVSTKRWREIRGAAFAH